MELLYTHLADRKRFTEAEFAARVGVPVVVYKPGKESALHRMRTSTLQGEVATAEWGQLKDQIREEASQYRVVRLGIQSNVRERVVRMGRATQNEIALNHQSVSKHHAALHVRHEGIFIVDLGSKNGTKSDNTVIGTEPKKMKPPTMITLGQVELRCLDPKSFYAFLGELLV